MLSQINNKIILQVENEIITSYEIKNKILTTLFLANQDINQPNIDKLKKVRRITDRGQVKNN